MIDDAFDVGIYQAWAHDVLGDDMPTWHEGTDLTQLDDVSRMLLVALTESHGCFEFPVELLEVMDTLGDLIHFANVRAAQKQSSLWS